jgi:hypothetical protein
MVSESIIPGIVPGRAEEQGAYDPARDAEKTPG